MAEQGPRRLVLDTSVAAKWYLRHEADAPAAWGLLERHQAQEVTLAAPDLLIIELVSTLVKRRLDDAEIQDALAALMRADLELHGLGGLAPDAAGLAVGFGLSAYEACFAALANQLGAPLVTADRKLADSGACDARLLGRDDC